MGDEILRIVEDQVVLHLFRLRIVAASEVELPEFFIVAGGNRHDVIMLQRISKNASRKMGRPGGKPARIGEDAVPQ